MKTRLTKKFERATHFAIRCHNGQHRKGSGAPYISHPMAVASLVLEYGGTETQAIAALLHDVIEDCGITHARIARMFGQAVARIVFECSDYFGPAGQPKPPWRERKERYVAHLASAHVSTLLVSAADKLHNARAIVHDVNHYGPKTWTRFNASPLEISWYYRSLIEAFRRRNRQGAGLEVILVELESWVAELDALAKARRRSSLARSRSRAS